MSKKVQIALVLLNRQYVRSWISSGLVDRLQKCGQFELQVFADSDTAEAVRQEISNCNLIELTAVKSKWAGRVVTADLIGHRSRSKTFMFRIERMFLPETRFFCRNQGFVFSVLWFFRTLKWTVGKFIENYKILFYFSSNVRKFVYWKFKKAKIANIFPNNYDTSGLGWIIVPAASSSSLVTDIIKFANANAIKTLIAVDNWDNLTSKSTYPVLPSVMTVMGRRDVMYAELVHRLDPRRVAPIGLPRFDVYRRALGPEFEKAEDQVPVILYCGFSLAHSERRVVDRLAWYMDSTKGPGCVRFVYRPHPGALPRFDDFEISNPRIAIYDFGDLSRTELPKTDREFIEQIESASIIVGAPTTLMLEAMILGKPCLLDLTCDDYHRTTAGIAARRYTHLGDLTSIPELRRGHTIDELCRELEVLVEHGAKRTAYSITDLFDVNGRSYQDELIRLLMNNS